MAEKSIKLNSVPIIKREILALLKEKGLNKDEEGQTYAEDLWVVVSNYYKKDRNWNTYNDIWEEMRDNIDNISIDTDSIDLWETLDGQELYEKATINDEILEEAFDEQTVKKLKSKLDNEDDGVAVKNLTKNQKEKLSKYLEDNIDDIEDEVLNELFGFDMDEIRTNANDEAFDGLAYWTVYFEPDTYDTEVAQKCRLIPFTYKDKGLLALGGSGMDLSPKLDCYQALTEKSIPNNSVFFRQRDYFEYVVGKSMTEEVEKKIKRDKPQVNLTFNVE